MKRDKFLDLKYVILHSLRFDNLIIFDFPINVDIYLNNILLKQIVFKNSFL